MTTRSGPSWVLGAGLALYGLAAVVALTSGTGPPELARVYSLTSLNIAQLGTVFWFYGENFAPYFVLMFYPLIKRSKVFDSLKLDVPLVFGVTLLFLSISWYYHLAADGADLAIGLWFLMRAGFETSDSFVLSGLAVVGADAYYQIPAYVVMVSWRGLWGLANILLSAGFAFMALPVFLYLILKTQGRIKTGKLTFALVLAIFISMAMVWLTYPRFDSYFSFPVWFAFLMSIAYESRGPP